jgi:SET domain-containing protein
MDKGAEILNDVAVGKESSNNSNKLSSSGIFSQHSKDISMWGLIAMEEIPAGAFLMEYLGEIVSKK